MDEELKDQIILYDLTRIRKAIEKNRFYFVPREENKATLLQLSLTVHDIKTCITKLTVKDHFKGPENDHDGSDGRVWIFKHPVSGCLIYIKMKLFMRDGEDFVTIISFHT